MRRLSLFRTFFVWALLFAHVGPGHDPFEVSDPRPEAPLINLDLDLAESHLVAGDSTKLTVTSHAIDPIDDQVTMELEFSPSLDFEVLSGNWDCEATDQILTCTTQDNNPTVLELNVTADSVLAAELAGVAGRISIGPLPDEKVTLASEVASHQDLVMLSIHPEAESFLTPIVTVDGNEHVTGARIDHSQSRLELVGKNESGVLLEAPAQLVFTLTPNYSGAAQFSGWDCDSERFESGTPLTCSLTTTAALAPGDSSIPLQIELESGSEGGWDVELETNGIPSFVHGFRVGSVETAPPVGALYALSHMTDGELLLTGHNTTNTSLSLLAVFSPNQVTGCVPVGLGESSIDVCDVGEAPAGSDSREAMLGALGSEVSGILVDSLGQVTGAAFSDEYVGVEPTLPTLELTAPHAVGAGTDVFLVARSSNGDSVRWSGDVDLEVSQHGSRAHFVAPEVDETTRLTFTASLIGRHSDTSETVSVVIHPTHSHTGFLDFREAPSAPARVSPAAFTTTSAFFAPTSLTSSTPTVTLNGGATTLTTQTGVAITLAASVANLPAPVTYTWSAKTGSTVSGTSDTVSFSSATEGSYEVTVTASGGGQSAQASLIVTVSTPNAPSQDTCQALGELTGGDDSVTFGPLVISGLNNATPVDSQECGGAAGVTLTDATATLFGLISLTNVSGTIDTVGVSLESATMSLNGMTGFGSFILEESLTATWTEAGQLAQFSASALATQFSYFQLPNGFSPALRLRLSPGDAQGLDISGVFSHVDDQAKAIGLSGPIPFDGTPYSFSLQGRAFQFGSVGVEVSGSIAGTIGQAPTTITAAGSLTSPVEIFSGFTITSLAVDLGETDITGSFGFSVDTGKQNILLAASGEFTDEDDFSLDLQLGDNSGSGWQPMPGLSINAAQFDGSLKAVSGEYTFDVSLGLGGSFKPMAGITVSDIVAEINNDCDGSNCPVIIGLSGDGEWDLTPYGLSVKESIDAAGQINTSSGRIELSATLGEIDLVFTKLTGATVLAIHDPTLSSDEENTAYVTGSGSFLNDAADIDVLLLPAGFRAQGIAQTTPPGGSKAQSVNFVYANFTGTIDPSFAKDVTAPPLTIPAGTLVGILPMALPPSISRSLASLLGLSSLPTGYAHYEVGASSQSLDLSMAAPNDLYLFGSSSANSSLRLTTLDVDITVGDLGTSFMLASDALMRFGSTTLDMITDISFAATDTGVSVTGAVELDASAQGGWSNALGVRGLTIDDFAVSVSIDELGVPSFGIAGDAILPDVIETKLGLVSGAEISIAMDIAAETPCLALGVKNGGQTAIDIGSGALTATQAGFTFAPFGCSIADIVYSPGYSLDFEGAISGVKADVSASFTLVPDLVFLGTADIGQFDIGPVTMTESILTVDIQPTLDSLSISGGMKIADTTVSASATVMQSAEGAYYDIKAEADPFTISTVTVQKAQIEGQIDLEPSSASFELAVAGDMVVGDYPEQANLDVTIANGQVTKFSGNAIVDIPIDAVEIVGSVEVSYVAPGAPSLEFEGSLAVNGRTLESAQGIINGNGVELSANLTIPDLASATLEGAIVWGSDPTQAPIDLTNIDGSSVEGQKGDYSFIARNVSLTPGGFSASGDIYVVSLSGATSFKGDAHLVVGSEVDVQLAGEFDADGSYQLSGSAKFGAVSGFGFDAEFVVDHSAADYVAVSGDLNIPNTVDASLSGTYLKPASGPALYTLDGAGTLLIHGQKEELQARLSNDPNNDPGFSGSTQISYSGLDASGDIIMKPQGMWWLDGSGDLNVSNAKASLNFSGGSCNDSSCSEKVIARFFAEGDVAVKSIDFNGKINVDEYGDFTATLTVKGSFKTSQQSIKVEIWPANYDAKFSVGVSYSLAATIKNTEADVKFSASAKIEDPNRDARTLGITGGRISGEISTTGSVSGSVTVDYDYIKKGSETVRFSAKL